MILRPVYLVVFISMGLMFFLVSSGCYNTKTGDVRVGGAISFKLPAFPETGSNAVQVFTEMHYQPSYRAQEVPRILPPSDSVPVTGAELKYRTLDDYAALDIPGEFIASYSYSDTRELFIGNCSVCHGLGLKGDGTITKMASNRGDGSLAMNTGPLPADLTLALTVNATDGELFGFITQGGRQGLAAVSRGKYSRSPMPAFERLLTEKERWELVQYLREQTGGR